MADINQSYPGGNVDPHHADMFYDIAHITHQSHLKAFVSASSDSNSTDSDVIPPAASLADAKNNILTDIDGMV